MRNHERSRKHREMVALLRQQLEKEEEELCVQQGEEGAGELEQGEETLRVSKKQKRKKRQQKMFGECSPDLSAAGESQSPSTTVSQSESKDSTGDKEERLNDGSENHQDRSQESASRTTADEREESSPSADPQQEIPLEGSGSSATPSSTPKSRGKKIKPERKGAKEAGREQRAQEAALRCVTCDSRFPSRNKLFEHLTMTGHARAVEDPAGTESRSSRSKQGKRRNR
ncbi:dnaJ homolog subfamily C member 21 [Heptranchias perlo]|uniref:dnaJ homolog subfamily C member 21 n=1 Tax=Heptranchias perlo TaxID=212740 RepID=UPI0035597C64